MMSDRRAFLAISAAAVTTVACPAFGQGLATPPARDFAVDWQGGPQTPAVAASLAAQISLVRSLRIKPEVAAFFAVQVITVDLADNTATRAGPRGVFFERKAMPPENPVLLHELLHRYHLLRLPDGFRNLRVRTFYEQAVAARDFPVQAYLYKNPIEFFAMVASVTLWGKAARPPYTRASVRQDYPAMYAWIVSEFGLSV